MTPRVRSATSAVASSIDVTKWVAPNRNANSRLASTGSTTTIFSAPASRAPWIAPLPMPPNPMITTVSPGATSAVLTAEPHPVVTPQPSRQARDNGMSSSILTIDASGTVPYCENVPTSAITPTSCPRTWRR